MHQVIAWRIKGDEPFTWTNTDRDAWCHIASLSHDKLTMSLLWLYALGCDLGSHIFPIRHQEFIAETETVKCDSSVPRWLWLQVHLGCKHMGENWPVTNSRADFGDSFHKRRNVRIFLRYSNDEYKDPVRPQISHVTTYANYDPIGDIYFTWKRHVFIVSR